MKNLPPHREAGSVAIKPNSVTAKFTHQSKAYKDFEEKKKDILPLNDANDDMIQTKKPTFESDSAQGAKAHIRFVIAPQAATPSALGVKIDS